MLIINLLLLLLSLMFDAGGFLNSFAPIEMFPKNAC